MFPLGATATSDPFTGIIGRVLVSLTLSITYSFFLLVTLLSTFTNLQHFRSKETPPSGPRTPATPAAALVQRAQALPAGGLGSNGSTSRSRRISDEDRCFPLR
jgi:hypothetical protein